ncbi:MAG: replicative DNA helicase [Bacteroidales bacterium]|jgi:replicative DNA helicase|nr:replicative DNA helicase [Bacteroidales bacterium]
MDTQQTNRFQKKRMSFEQAFSLNNNQVPPQIVEVEESVLGALLLDQDAVTNTIDTIKPEYFYKLDNQEIFNAILILFREGSPIDVISVTEKLKKLGKLDEVGGTYKIATLTSRVTSAAHVEYYVRLLTEKYIQRELIRVSTETLKEAYDETTDVVELLDKTESRFLDINEQNFNSDSHNMQSLLFDSIKEIETLQNSDIKTTGLETGFVELDRNVGGFQKGTLIILAARPAMGKTAFAMSMARNMAVDFHKPVAFFSLEMTASELMMRLISSETEIQGDKLKRGDALSMEELERIKEKTRGLGESPLYIDDNPGLSIFELRAKCRRMKQKYDIQMVFIDYLQLMSGGEAKRNDNREQEISFISRQLKGLSKELGIPILAMSQLSREVEKRGGSKEPVLSDLRESGAIEQDADIVMFIHRPEYYNIVDDEYGSTQGIAYINVAKNRSGALSKSRLGFMSNYVKFYNINQTLGIASSILPANASFDEANGVVTLSSSMNSSLNTPQEPTDFDNGNAFE